MHSPSLVCCIKYHFLALRAASTRLKSLLIVHLSLGQQNHLSALLTILQPHSNQRQKKLSSLVLISLHAILMDRPSIRIPKQSPIRAKEVPSLAIAPQPIAIRCIEIPIADGTSCEKTAGG